MNIKKDLCELDPDEVPFYTDEDISLALADDDEAQSENGISNISLLWISRDAVKIKIAKFRGFVLKRGRGSHLKPIFSYL